MKYQLVMKHSLVTQRNIKRIDSGTNGKYIDQYKDPVSELSPYGARARGSPG